MHRSNAADKGVQTYKNHLTAVIAILPDDFPIAFWDRLIPQGDWSLNVMRPCRLNPKLSAFEALEGSFHFTSTPFAPPGTKVLAHEKPGRCASWGFHANKGRYIGPALNHHQCYRYITQSTGAEQITDTIKFQHHNVKVPQLTAADIITSAVRELQRAIKQQPAKAPMEELQAIKMLCHVLLGEKPLKLTTRPTLTTTT